jgi:hypothetical protein
MSEKTKTKRNYPFYEIYNNINAILRLIQTKESVSKYVELMLEIRDMWHGYMKKKKMMQANMINFFQAICDIVFSLNKRIQMTRIKLINNDQERVTYMINFLAGVLEDIKKYEYSVFKLYEHVLHLLESYNPPELKPLKPLYPEHVPEEEEEVEDGGDGDGSVFDGGEGINQDGRKKKVHVNVGILNLLCRMNELNGGFEVV